MTFRRFYPNPEALLKDMPRWKPGLNYWIGVALRRNTQGGKKENLLALTAAFSDVDVGEAGHKGVTSYKDKPAARAAIEAFQMRPSILIDSGGGFQCYWLYREPVQHLSEAEIAKVEGINRGLALALGGDIEVKDVARILRLPGTFNMKLAGQPRPVKVVWCEPERVYDLAELAKHEDKSRAQSPRQAHQGGAAGPDGEYAAYASKALADELAALARTPAGGRNARLNQAAFALGQLVGAGLLARGSVEAALAGVAAGIGLGEVEARATIQSGLDSGIKQPRELPEKGRKGGPAPRPGIAPASEAEPEGFWLCGHRYFVERGHLCLEGFDRKGVPYTTPLANFQAQIVEENSRDDGLKKTKEFRISGNLDTGQVLPPALVPAEKFATLSWVMREWGAAASLAPGRSLGPHLVNAIQAHSRGVKRRTLLGHSGWREIEEAWRYLHGGGAIGSGKPVEVDLGENLHHYRLPDPGGVEAARASLRFLDICDWGVTAPLLACAYLAPFADLLKVDFSLWIFGPTGSMKSTLAALALCHFGEFNRLTLPGSWFSTANSLERLCFILKDNLIVIDDFMPPASAKDFHGMGERAGRLIYQAGNRSGRGRLAPDLTARPNYYPRGLIISTGEVLLPGQRQSATARYMGVEMDPKKTPINMVRLTSAQNEANLYSEAMAAYLADLAPRLEEAQEDLRALFEAYRGAFQKNGHARIPEIQSWLAVGFESCLRFQVVMGAISQDEASQMLNKAWRVFEALGEAHGRRIEGERATIKFLAILTELFLTRRIFAESAASSALFQGTKPPRENLLGWTGNQTDNAYLVGYADETMVYLLPDQAYKAVNEVIRAQGDYLALGKNEMLAALAREELIEVGKDGKPTRFKWIQGGSKRVIYLPRRVLGHDEVMEDEQPLLPGSSQNPHV